jgi:hypothetical protein
VLAAKRESSGREQVYGKCGSGSTLGRPEPQGCIWERGGCKGREGQYSRFKAKEDGRVQIAATMLMESNRQWRFPKACLFSKI